MVTNARVLILERPPNADPLACRWSIQWVCDFQDILSAEAAFGMVTEHVAPGASRRVAGSAQAGGQPPSQVRTMRRHAHVADGRECAP